TLRSRIDELLTFFDLTEKRNVIGKQLSRGMQQKLAIACSLLHDPEILLLDEPTLGLDVAAARMVKERVQQLSRERGLTVVLTTHQMDVAQELCQRIGIITRGQLRVLDETANLLSMFTRQEYEFKAAGAVPEAELSRYGAFTPVEANGSTTFRLLLPDSQALYGVMNCLQRAGTQILHVNKLEANLEEVFLQVTQGDQPPALPAEPLQGVEASA
ncbi:MAG: AAA family ATPase, partial [Mycobacterium leprae]